ncbi:MAG: hypothetical protein ABIQ18_35030 [Umezawaea sp.]
MLDIVGRQVFEADVISLNGLDDRLMTNGVIERAQADGDAAASMDR